MWNFPTLGGRTSHPRHPRHARLRPAGIHARDRGPASDATIALATQRCSVIAISDLDVAWSAGLLSGLSTSCLRRALCGRVVGVRRPGWGARWVAVKVPCQAWCQGHAWGRCTGDLVASAASGAAGDLDELGADGRAAGHRVPGGGEGASARVSACAVTASWQSPEAVEISGNGRAARAFRPPHQQRR
jgi:hypothetical protein